MTKSAEAFRTISEAAAELDLPQHVLRFWETRFPQIKPLKRAGGRRFYRPADVVLLTTIRQLLYGEGYTIKGVQRLLREHGVKAVQSGLRPDPVVLATEGDWRAEPEAAAESEGDESGAPALVPASSPALSAHARAEILAALGTILECETILRAAIGALPPLANSGENAAP